MQKFSRLMLSVPLLGLGASLFVSGGSFRMAAAEAPALSPAVATNLAVLANPGATLKDKADACRELARVGGPEAVAPLAALLADPQLNHAARYGLETIPDPAVDTALRKALEQLKGRPLVGVIGSLGVRRDAAAVPLLVKLLQDPDNEVAQAAARSLGSIAQPAGVTALEAGLNTTPATNQLAFCEGLLRAGERFMAQGRAGDAHAIYDLLRARPLPHQARTAAWRGAILSRGSAGLPLLTEALTSKEFPIFVLGVRISDEVPGTSATLVLARQLAQAPADRAIMLLQALGRRGDATALPALSETASKGEKAIRLEALRALSQCANPKSVPVLEKLLFDADRDVAKAAGESLAALPGTEASAAILALLMRPDREPMLTGMDLAARRRLASAVPALKKAAGHSDPAIRSSAIKTLGGLASDSDIPSLLDLSAQAHDGGELEAIEQALSATCLRSPTPGSCVPKLVAAFASARTAQKGALLHTLNAVGGPAALDAVRGALKDPETGVRTTAIRTLASWSTRDAAPDLLTLARAEDQPAVKLLCLRSYLGFASQGDTPEAQRLAMCRDAASLASKPEEKKLLLAALGGIPSPEALALVEPSLDDAAIRTEAASAALDISAKILEGQNAAQAAGKLVVTLGKVQGLNASADLTARAGKLLDQAKAKAK